MAHSTVIDPQAEYANKEAERAAREAFGVTVAYSKKYWTAFRKRYREAYREYPLIEEMAELLVLGAPDESVLNKFCEIVAFKSDLAPSRALEMIGQHRPELGQELAEAVAMM